MDYLQAGNLTTFLLEREVQVEFSITIVDDDTPEAREEGFNVALIPREDYQVAGLDEAVVYIEDDDGQWEGGGVAVFSILQSCCSLIDTPPSANSCHSLPGDGPLRCLRGGH